MEDEQYVKTQEETKSNDTRKYGFGIAPFFGIVHGQAIELVYPIETKGEYLSELLWDMKPVFYLGLKLDFGRKNLMDSLGFFASASFRIGIPGDSGIQENRDWMSTQNANLTHFSSHTNRTDEFMWSDILVGMNIPLKYLYIIPHITGSWMRFSFSGRDGKGTYAKEISEGIFHSIDNNPTIIDFTGQEVIKYEQNWCLLSPGFTIGTNLFLPFIFDLSFQISPLTYCAAIDQHLTTGVTYYDFTGFGLYIEPKSSVSFNVNMFSFTLEFAYRCIISSEGETYLKGKDGEIYRSFNAPGAGLSVFDIHLLVRILI